MVVSPTSLPLGHFLLLSTLQLVHPPPTLPKAIHNSLHTRTLNNVKLNYGSRKNVGCVYKARVGWQKVAVNATGMNNS